MLCSWALLRSDQITYRTKCIGYAYWLLAIIGGINAFLVLKPQLTPDASWVLVVKAVVLALAISYLVWLGIRRASLPKFDK